MTQLEELELKLSDLEAKEAQLTRKLGRAKATLTTEFEVLESPYECRHLLVVLKDLKQLEGCLQWLQRHGPACYSQKSHLTVAFPWHETVQLTRSTATSDPQFTSLLAALPNEQVCLFGFRPLELTRGCVRLAQHAAPESGRVADVVVVGGCAALSRREFEDPDYTPLLEEILLKEAIQPIILIK